MKRSKKYLYALVFISIGSGMNWYKPRFISLPVSHAIWNALIYICLILFTVVIFRRKTRVKTEFDNCFYIIIFSIFISVFSGYLFHGQSLLTGAMATLVYSYYLIFFIFKRSFIQRTDIDKCIVIMGVLNIAVTILAFLTIPDCWIGTYELDLDRGEGFRIRVGVGDWIYLLLCFSLSKIFIFKRKKYIFIVILCLLSLFSSLTRQVIAITMLIVFLFILFETKRLVKIICLCIVFFSFLYIIKTPLAQTLIEMTIKQKEMSVYKEDDIRLAGAKYFLYEGNDNIITAIVGNGMFSPNNSKYGELMAKKGYFPADIGYLGFYYLFGIFAIFSLLLILYRSIIKRKDKESRFVTYYLISFALSNIIAGPITYPCQIMVFCLMLYYISIPKSKNLNEIAN